MKIVVCDDHPDEVENITAVLRSCDHKGGYSLKSFCDSWQVLDFFNGGAEADIVFLDIVMPGATGIALAEDIRALGFTGAIVFVSAVNDYAAQSYQIGAFSYLLKPVKQTELQSVLDKAEDLRSARDRSGFVLKWRGGGSYVLFSELMYVEVQNHHLYFHLNNGEVLRIYGTLSDYTETLLMDSRMAHNNRSYVINMDYISKCENSAVYLKDGARISISHRYDEFRSTYFRWVFGAYTSV